MGGLAPLILHAKTTGTAFDSRQTEAKKLGVPGVPVTVISER